MYINEVCKICSLTKKAVEYYEKKGLIHPEIAENGYRVYDEKDISMLKEVALLRKLGLSISQIKDVSVSSNKSLALSKYKYLLDLEKEKAEAQEKCLDQLINQYDVEKGLEYADLHLNHIFSIKEKLVEAFPGSYGIFLAIHFGPFLTESLNSPEKEQAYKKVTNFLDHLTIPEEMERYLEENLPSLEKETLEHMHLAFMDVLEDAESLIAQQQESIEEYIKLRISKEYKLTPAYKIQQLLIQFQQSSCYFDIFIPNLKILSTSYRKYSEKLQAANAIFLEKYPEAAQIYDGMDESAGSS